MSRIEFLRCPMHAWTMEQTLAEIDRRVAAREFTQHVVVNVAKLVNMRRDPDLREAIVHCDIINIDGMGVVWGARWLGYHVPERVAGVDLFLRLLELSAAKGYPVFLLGATREVVERAVAFVRDSFPRLQVTGYHHGYFWGEEEAVVEKIRRSGARLLFVAITSPKKERFIERWKAQLGVDFVMGVGGTFDVVAGRVRRAPVWMQKAGLEWLYRVIQEPRRMWRRYFFTNAIYGWLLLMEKLRRAVGR